MTNETIRIAVAGAGNVGRFVAKDLTGRGHEVVVIEQDRGLIEGLKAEYDYDFN